MILGRHGDEGPRRRRRGRRRQERLVVVGVVMRGRGRGEEGVVPGEMRVLLLLGRRVERLGRVGQVGRGRRGRGQLGRGGGWWRRHELWVELGLGAGGEGRRQVRVVVLTHEGVRGRGVKRGRRGGRVHGRGSVHEVGVGRRVWGGQHWWDGWWRRRWGELGVDVLRGVLL